MRFGLDACTRHRAVARPTSHSRFAGRNGLIALGGSLLLLISASVTGQGILRCEHPDGQIEFRSFPLAGAECVTLEQQVSRPGPSTVATPAEPSQATVEEDTQSSRPETTRERNCRIATSNLELLQSDAPVLAESDDGEPVNLDADGRAAALERAQRDADYWCDPT